MAAFRISDAPPPWAASLLDLGFLEDDVLARDRVVLLELKLFRRGARVLARDVVVAGIGRTHELDHDRRLLGHGAPWSVRKKEGREDTAPALPVKRRRCRVVGQFGTETVRP